MPSKSKLLFVVLFVALGLQSPVARSYGELPQTDSQDSTLLETGRASKLRKGTATATEFKIVSFNIRWRGREDLKKLGEVLRNDPEIGEASVIGLQEVDRNKKRTGNENTVKQLAEELGMYYAWAAPPPPKPAEEEETGVALLSPYPLTEVKRLVLPHKGPGGRRRAGIGATFKINGANVRVYSVHSETRMSMDKKVEQMKAALDDLATFPRDMPAIVMGDLNTWESDAHTRTIKLFKSAGFHTPFDGDSTFCQQILFVPLKLKLDWMWLKNIEVKAHGIDRQVKLSDHYPLWMRVSLNRPATAPVTIVQ